MALYRSTITRTCTCRLGIRSLATRNIFHPDPDEDHLNKLTKQQRKQQQQQSQQEKPWDGDESVADSVLRMIMDKYNKPLRVEGAARRHLPQPQVHPSQVQGLYDDDKQETSSGEKAVLRDKLARSKKQKRIMSARDAAFDYSMERKYPSTKQEKEKREEEHEQERPRSIAEIASLAEERIREAKAKGHFDNLAGRGKPIPVDIHESNPFVDRTEYFLNRIVQRQGAAAPWIMMQQEVDTEITQLRTSLERSLELCMMDDGGGGISSTASRVFRDWQQQHGDYFEKLFEKVNQQVRSYNVMCPASVRKNRINLDEELQDVYRRLTTQNK
ncbi:hypothetical protein O0I10_005460 [Lichtheimia ornata]|uniref:DnaJ homologue subfamily C member 28 conserved domain-containing protein n=1 Tax=Lichtheimia ornata TaxID=688661 RepID=A0AAD7V6V1_9FUNG|nr:uncharacterized protein O0I10_005460 [Lichtheimia ornata]KAJ8658736.1 hypothetical protein O0I10_005460 [Lichtheimia ornata]